MLGWEFPPYITGGLGTACYGLTKGLDRRGVKVTFVLPKAVDAESSQHVDLVTPETPTPRPAPSEQIVSEGTPPEPSTPGTPSTTFKHVEFVGVPAGFSNPYQREPGPHIVGRTTEQQISGTPPTPGSPGTAPVKKWTAPVPLHDYGDDIMVPVEQYAEFCLKAVANRPFDIIHAHDWMTYAAGLQLARVTGRPLVVHVHSTEFDRSGESINKTIYDIERRGMHGALRVIAVSQLTKNVIVNRYGIPAERVTVVYNGVELEPKAVGMTGIERRDKIVLYFGRITYQKGPEYFIAAARRVLDVMDDVKFVVAGSGDLASRMIEMAADLGIGHKILFTGFLRGRHIQQVFAIADLYVMPSISEPFGIAPLEAMSQDVPVLISRSSGVSEVLTHALKVDFWDIDDMANKIVAVLRYPPLSQTLRDHGAFEVRRINWAGAAQRCEKVYSEVIHEMSQTTLPIGV
jgi:glycosyltransferase involved in cell wall biosynthesis